MRTRSRPRLFVTDRGSGEPVLLITGWTISSAVFDPIADLYVPHVRVLAYDHRGGGRSAAWLAPVSAAMLAADAARVLDDRGVRSAHVVGLSLGAGVALELAIRMPHRVRSLVLVGGSAGGPTTVLPDVAEAAARFAPSPRTRCAIGRCRRRPRSSRGAFASGTPSGSPATCPTSRAIARRRGPAGGSSARRPASAAAHPSGAYAPQRWCCTEGRT